MTTENHPLLRALEKKSASSALLAQTAELQGERLKKWIQVMDESPFSVDQWAEALIEFNAWELKEQRTLGIEHKLEYLSCCTESGMPAHLLSLPFLLQEYLRDHGVED